MTKLSSFVLAAALVTAPASGIAAYEGGEVQEALVPSHVKVPLPAPTVLHI